MATRFRHDEQPLDLTRPEATDLERRLVSQPPPTVDESALNGSDFDRLPHPRHAPDSELLNQPWGDGASGWRHASK